MKGFGWVVLSFQWIVYDSLVESVDYKDEEEKPRMGESL